MGTTNIQPAADVARRAALPTRQPGARLECDDAVTDYNLAAANNIIQWTAALTLNQGYFWAATPTPSRLYVRQAGLYLLHWRATFISDAVGNRYIPRMKIIKNAATVLASGYPAYLRNQAATSQTATGELTTLVSLAAGDYVITALDRGGGYTGPIYLVAADPAELSAVFVNSDAGMGQ